jgi:hypothetical protein
MEAARQHRKEEEEEEEEERERERAREAIDMVGFTLRV